MSSEGAKPVKLLIWNTTSKTWEKFDGSITAGDIEIGQVELKDSDSTAQGNIKAANTARTTATIVLATQSIDAAGAVLSTSALATSANQLADGHNVTVDNVAGAGVYIRPGTSVNLDTSAIAGTVTANAGTNLNTSALATSAKQLADDHNVTVSNPTADPETGLATSAKQLADGHGVAASQAGNWDINDISKGTQTNDVKVTLDSEVVSVAPSKASSAGTNTAVSVGSSSTTVLASNANRKQAILVNDSDEEMYLKYGSTAVANSGLRLNAYGGTVVETVYTGVIDAICASGSKVITVLEA